MKIIIAGSRGFSDYNYMKSILDPIIATIDEDITIVSGCAAGADRLGEDYARERGLDIKMFPAQWDRYGKRAGYLRNTQMANYADMLVAFWDGQSKGTKHMIDIAESKGLEVFIIT